MKYLFLTFDLEEFDMAKRYCKVDEDRIYEVSYEGTGIILSILEEMNIKGTFFVTFNFLEKYPKIINDISKNHEIASHGYHSHNYSLMPKNDAFNFLKKVRIEIRSKIKKDVLGFRAPRMKRAPFDILKKAGFLYDSSLHPTYVPGRYNNLRKPRLPFVSEGIVCVPISTTPLLRLPISYFWFRNFGYTYAVVMTSAIKDDLINLYFHPWEFVDLKEFDIPYLYRRNTGEKMINEFRMYIKWCLKNGYTGETISNYIKEEFLNDIRCSSSL